MVSLRRGYESLGCCIDRRRKVGVAVRETTGIMGCECNQHGAVSNIDIGMMIRSLGKRANGNDEIQRVLKARTFVAFSDFFASL